MSSPRSQNAAIFTNNTEFLTVDDAGRVGVGTVTPNSDAHPQNVGKINVGFITARSVAGDIDANTLVVAGISTFVDTLNAAAISGTSVGTAALTVTSTGLFASDVSIAENIVHTGDTNTKISFPAADTIAAQTGGTEALRIDSSQRLLLGTTTEGHSSADDLTIATSGNTGITLRSGTSSAGNIYFSDATSGTAEYAGFISYSHSTNAMSFGTNGSNTERIQITSTGLVGIVETNPLFALDIKRVENKLKLKSEIILEKFFSKNYFCYMTGFVAGMPFLGDLNQEMRLKRLETPRVKVPKGSVGILSLIHI